MPFGPVSTLPLDEVICMPVILAEHQDGEDGQENALAREEQDEFFLAAAAIEANYVKKPLQKARRSSGRGKGRRLVRDTAFDAEYAAFVARSVGKAEAASNPECDKAVLKEWDKLRNVVWNESKPRSWREVVAESERDGK